MDIEELNRGVIAEFRANAGKVGGPYEGISLLLLTTVGAKSGLPRTNPLVYFADEDRFVIIASYAGAPANPPWYYNLQAHPNVEIEVGTERIAVRAEVMGEPERTAFYAKAEAALPFFAEYQSKTTRTIPVVALYT